MRIRVFFIFILLFISTGGFPQKFLAFETYDVDSLRMVLPDQDSEERVNTLNRLAASLSFVDVNLSRAYADSAMALAKNLNFREGIADAYLNYGYICQYLGQYHKSLVNYYESLSIFLELDKKKEVFLNYFFIARTHYLANNFEKAVEIGNIALEKSQERLPDGSMVGSIRDLANFKAALGQTYSIMGLFEDALKMRLEVLALVKANHTSDAELICATWVAGVDYYAQGKLDSAKMYFQEAISYPDVDINAQAQKYRAIMWLADLYYSEGKKDLAIAYMRKALAWYDEKGALVWALNASCYLGQFYLGLDDDTRAETSFRESERLFDDMVSRNSVFRSDVSKNIAFYGFELYFPVPPRTFKELMWGWGTGTYYYLYTICEKKNRTIEALHYHILYSNALDTLTGIQRNRETVELQTRYESEQKERQIKYLADENAFKSFKLRQSRIILFGLAGLITLVILLAIAMIRQGRLREKQNSLILRQKLFRSQMNPHFIFNSLASIHHFMINEEPVKAASYLSRFSKLIRSILQSSVEEYVPITNEIVTIENYLELQKVRFPDKFDFTVEVDKDLDAENTSIPCMIIQPFVENAIEHGIKHKSSKGNVSVRIHRENKTILIEVEDNGVGRAKARELSSQQNEGHRSMATGIIQERIRALNRTLKKKKITLDILDLKNDSEEPLGTKVVLRIPY